jgi:hypothetical protein
MEEVKVKIPKTRILPEDRENKLPERTETYYIEKT